MPDDPHNLAEFSPLASINDVLLALDQIVKISIKENSTAGIFAYVYRRTTVKIKEGIAERRFEDNRRMELFDVAFARKYIEAYWNHRKGKPVSKAWNLSFSTTNASMIIMQHILLGMNAHINLDLGITAAEFAPGKRIYDLENDFMMINELLAELIDEVQDRIGSVSPLMFLVDWISQSDDEAIINFSITKARDCAWDFARTLAKAPNDQKAQIIARVDNNMTKLGNIVATPPGFFIPKLLGIIRYFEDKNTRSVIQKLQV